MAFNGLMLTDDGRTLKAKMEQGKKLHITRVAVGDGIIGNGSLVSRTNLISQKMSLLIDAILVINQTDSAIVVTLSNENLTEGFYFREIGVFAQDPDTLQEKLYLYDAAGTDGEPIPDMNSSTRVYERLKLIVSFDNAESVTFAPSGNPLYLTPDDINDSVIGEHTLWSSSKVNAEINNVIGEHVADETKHVGTENKYTPVNADSVALVDSADSSKVKRLPFVNLVSWLTNYLAAKNHKSTSTAYGVGDGSNYGHLRLSDATNYSFNIGSGYAATPYAVKQAYDLASGKADALHKSRHAAGGEDELTPADIGAATADGLQAAEEKSLLRDLRIMLNLSLGTSNIDAVADTCTDNTMINTTLSSNYIIDSGKLSVASSNTSMSLASFDAQYTWGYPGNPGYEKSGQTFKATQTGVINQIKVWLSKYGAPTDTVIMKIYASDKTTLLGTATNVIYGTSLLTYQLQYTFNFNDIPVTQNTEYFFSLERSGALDGQNLYYVHFNGSNTSYLDGSRYFTMNNVWYMGAGDCAFEINIKTYPNPANIFWKAEATTEPLEKVAVVSEKTLGYGALTIYVSDDGSTWIEVTSEGTMQTVSFTNSAIYLKAVLTGNAALSSVAWGGF
jgi:hypothetical protein